MKKTALEYLNKDPLHHLDMIELINRELCELTYVSDNGVMLTYDKGFSVMLSCDSLELAMKLLGDCPYNMIAIHQDYMKDELCRVFHIENTEECWQGAYTRDIPLPLDDCDIRLLDSEYLDFLCSNYEHGDRDYMQWLIEQRVMYGIFVENEIAGFIGRHSEGSIGLLKILPEYRRRGLAEKLYSFYINLELSQGHRPYGQIFVGNTASRRLNEKLGIEFSDKTVTWLWNN